MTEDISELKEAEQQSVQTTRSWNGGAILIGLGVIFLLHNLNVFHLDNWWALFILMPAVANLGTAWRSYQQHGRLTPKAHGSLTGGVILSLVAATFLFSWSWSVMWPVFLIVGGLSALLHNR